MSHNDTIAAPSTGSGGAIAIIRLSGPGALAIASGIFSSASGKSLSQAKGYTMHYGEIMDDGRIVDDVIISVFRAPNSYTGEDMVEISCHGSSYIQQEILNLLVRHGAKMAQPGEFTMRAYMSGKMDLSQAEAVGDLIASESKASHALASNQMRGGYSSEFAVLREELLKLSSLLELELDFSEEDVEFADRGQLSHIMAQTRDKISSLIDTFSLSNAIKEGVAVAIAGKPNAGKSTLLNALLNDDRAMVSDIPGTTRDVIEECVNLEGVKFRFLDTAGIRDTSDQLELMGIERTMSSIAKSNIILYLLDAQGSMDETIEKSVGELSSLDIKDDQHLLLLINKTDKYPGVYSDSVGYILNAIASKGELNNQIPKKIIPISAKTGIGLNELRKTLTSLVDTESVFSGQTIVSNVRHYEALRNALSSLQRAQEGLESNIPSDLLAQDIREAIFYLGSVTGTGITADDILGNIFANFCIGK